MKPLDFETSSPIYLNICGLIVTHNPDEKLHRLLIELENQTDHTIIVDNASGKESLGFLEKASQSPNMTILKNSENIGLAAALNVGVEKAIELGYPWTITFDQDSKPDSDLIEKLCNLYQLQKDPSKIAIIAPQIIDMDLEREAYFLRKKYSIFFERAKCKGNALRDVTTVITTGSMIKNSVFHDIRGFREDFFIDYVDTEFCLRLLDHGYQIMVACETRLHHTLGNRKKRKWGPFTFYPTFHPPERWYTISRNRIQMIKSYGLHFPHWLSYELVASGYTLLRMLFMEDDRLAKIAAFFKGTWDGMRGKLGKPPWASNEINIVK